MRMWRLGDELFGTRRRWAIMCDDLDVATVEGDVDSTDDEVDGYAQFIVDACNAAEPREKRPFDGLFSAMVNESFGVVTLNPPSAPYTQEYTDGRRT